MNERWYNEGEAKMQSLQDRDLKGDSVKWKNWMSALISTTCTECARKHGTVFPFDVDETQYVPAHINGQCKIVPMRTKQVGTATDDGVFGADVYLIYESVLPDNYISKEEALDMGWDSLAGNLSVVAPGKTIYQKHQNRYGMLPSAPGRSWYEADINYYGGYRGHDRILFSNDGLVFVSYDHYKTYYEIVRGK